MVRRLLLAFSLLSASCLAPCCLFAGEWPEDYIVQENSTSPDGHYALLVQTADGSGDHNDVYLADVKAHTALGTIKNVDYFEHQNHRSLLIFWAPDSSYCVVKNDDRYGLDTAIAVEIKAGKLVQTQIDGRIQKSLDDVMKKQSRDKEIAGDVSPHFRLGNDRKIRVRATSQNNPKQFESVKTYYGLFQGTYDLGAKRWLVTDARSITPDQSNDLDIAYQSDLLKHILILPEGQPVPNDFTGSIFHNDEEEFDALDTQLNQVYQAMHFILPPNRFAKIKQEQIAWVKNRDPRPVKEKSKLTQERITALQEVLW